MMLNKTITDSYPMGGDEMYELAKKLFPICRSITGNGVRRSHDLIKAVIPELTSKEISSGKKCFDWVIPSEWNIKDAYIETLNGVKVVDFNSTNLHVVNYSEPVNREIDLCELQNHLHSRKDMPTAIPYVTSYYKRGWGFCLSDNLRKTLNDKRYRVVIDSTLEPGSMTYGELILPGSTSDEILISTYTCHPSMGNNEVSGMVVAAFLGKWLASKKDRKYTYRIIFVPETIGAVAYLSMHLPSMKKNTKAGFVITCVGDDRSYSYMPSKKGNTLADKAVIHAYEKVLRRTYKAYTFQDRGSDERQYCHPNVDLPVCSAMRTKYGAYPEYHTSLDDLNVISSKGLFGGYEINKVCLEVVEANAIYMPTTIGEPWLASRNLRPPLIDGIKLHQRSTNLSNLLAYCDGKADLIDIANVLDLSVLDLSPLAEELVLHGLLNKV